jgi:hypothetical protein
LIAWGLQSVRLFPWRLEIIIVRIGEGRDHPFRIFRRMVRLRDYRGTELLDSFEFSLHILRLKIEHYPFGGRVLAMDFVMRAKPARDTDAITTGEAAQLLPVVLIGMANSLF